MSHAITLAIVGAGSSYTPELIAGILDQPHEDLPVRAIRLHDIRSERMDVIAGLARRMVAHQDRDIAIESGTDLEAALAGARFVITQIRVGGMAARRLDEEIPLSYGVLGQETTGPGGMFKALRTIPPMLEIGRAVARVAPDAFILNYTNPSGIVTEAVAKHTRARIIGLCSGMPGIIARLKTQLAARFPNLQVYCVGLNHLGFVHRVLADGRDVTEEALDIAAEQAGDAGELIRLLRAVPISYVHYYLRRRDKLRQARAREKSRAETVMEIEKEVFEQAADPERRTKPPALQKRGGGGYANITFSFMKAILHDTGLELPCTVRNRGAVAGIEHDAGVEIVCRVGKDGPTPLPVGPIPLAFRGLVQAVKAYETLTVRAAVERSRALVIQALLAHPLVGDKDIAVPLADELLQAHNLAFN
ncbi:MAG: 6-phospho-beta-glucosidase [Kiritimatiellae bacterium]|nr:6-phospho-beta-glucosidase [Kiritimatiellia bacterium]